MSLLLLLNPIRGRILAPAAVYTNTNVLQRTNYVENSTMVGAVAGSPGTLPTTWFDSTT